MGDFEKLIFNDVVVVVINLCRGTLNESRKLGNFLDEEITSGSRKIIVDLERCEFIDSTFIGTLVIRYKNMRDKGGKLKLVLPSKQMDIIFAITNALGFFDTFRSRKEAMDSFIYNEN